MELDEAERAAVSGGSGAGKAGGGISDVPPPRDPVEAWERAISTQFRNLTEFAKRNDCILTRPDLPELDYGKGGMEHEIFHDEAGDRFWKSTFPEQAGFGPSGYTTPIGYLRRLRLSNLIFGDDVRFEGIWPRRDGPSIVTSQRYILPDPFEGVPTEEDVSKYMASLRFIWDEKQLGFYRKEDGVLVQDCHPRNYVRAADGELYAIDIQPFLDKGRSFDEVVAHTDVT
ncbi:MAG: hypothetical protein MI807_04165 [Verrucomicrobiales bacterium]|nr:hypothetical protein [Verrucomicrobiales bacterium]